MPRSSCLQSRYDPITTRPHHDTRGIPMASVLQGHLPRRLAKILDRPAAQRSRLRRPGMPTRAISRRLLSARREQPVRANREFPSTRDSESFSSFFAPPIATGRVALGSPTLGLETENRAVLAKVAQPCTRNGLRAFAKSGGRGTALTPGGLGVRCGNQWLPDRASNLKHCG